MTAVQAGREIGSAERELERAHGQGVRAAVAGLSDAQLGGLRLTGSGVPLLAEAAVTSATPYLRVPLVRRISAALRLHPPGGEPDERCPICQTAVPCATAQALSW